MAFTAIILFFLIVVVGRIGFHYRLTGTSGVKFDSESLSFPSFFIQFLLIGIGWYGLIVLSILEVLDIIHSQINFGLIGIIFGWIIIIVGSIIAVVAQYQMGTSWRYVGSKSNDTELIIHGLFRYSRNPIYVGSLIFFFGLVILLPHFLMLLCFIFIFIGLEILVRYHEEPHLREMHGKAYENYCDEVSRFIPRI